MARTHRLPLLLLATALPAQTATSPAGYLNAEANYSHGYAFGYASDHVFLFQVDGTLAGTGARAIKRLHLRRDGSLPANADYVARTVATEVRVAHADWSKATSGNYGQLTTVLKSAWTTAFTLKSVNLPALAAAPAGQPAPWSITLTLDVPFNYDGTNALAIGLRTDPNPTTLGKQYPLDFVQETAYSAGATTKLGTGCTVAGVPQPMTHSHFLWNYGFDGSYGYSQLATNGAKPSVPIVALIGAASPALAFGGCELLYSTGQVALAGTTGASGYGSISFSFPQQPSFAGVPLYTQMAIADAAQPGVGVALSNGTRVVYPPAPLGVLRCAVGQINSGGTTWPAAVTLWRGRGLVLGLGS